MVTSTDTKNYVAMWHKCLDWSGLSYMLYLLFMSYIALYIYKCVYVLFLL